MNRLFLLAALTAFAACSNEAKGPQEYLDSLLSNPVTKKDVTFLYKVNALPADYFVAREFLRDQTLSGPGRDSLRAMVEKQYAGVNYFLIRIELDSSSSESPFAQSELLARMLDLQSNQERARGEISGLLDNGKAIHPDIFIIDSDLISHQSVAILFGFRKRDSQALQRIEFGKSFVATRNQSVAIRDLEPKFRLKG